MIAVLKKTASKDQIESLKGWFENKGLKVNESQGEFCTVLGLIGDTTQVDIEMLQGLDIIESVTRSEDRRRKFRGNGRSLLRRIQRADHRDCKARSGCRRDTFKRRRIQAQDITL